MMFKRPDMLSARRILPLCKQRKAWFLWVIKKKGGRKVEGDGEKRGR
jgi:hypothetical protein